MSTGARIPWADAYALAEEVAERLAPVVGRLKCVGSVRRRKPTVGDLEFVAGPIMHADLFGGETPVLDPIRHVMHELGTWVKGGDRMMQVTDLLGRRGLTLDLYVVHPPAAWGSQVAIRTGPADLGHYVVTACRRYGYRHDQGHAQRLDTGEAVPTDTEEEFFALAEVPCVPPPDREALAKRLWETYRAARQHVVPPGWVS